MELLTVGSKNFAVGLWWQTLERREGLLKQARALAKEVNQTGQERPYECVALRNKTVYQAGFGQGKAKNPSLAATIAAGQSGTWLGRFEFADGVWIVAVVDDNIIPRGDFFGPAYEADELLEEFEQVAHFETVLKPETIEESMAMLQELVRAGGGGRGYGLHFVEPHFPWGPVIAVGLLLIVGVVGYQIYARTARAKAARIQAARIEAARKAVAAGQQNVVKPWEQVALPHDILAACREGMQRTSLFDQGWKLVNWNCAGTSMTSDWKRTADGSFEHLPKGGVLNVKKPEDLQVSLPIKALTPRGKQDLGDLNSGIARIYEIARTSGANVSIKWARPQPITTSAKNSKDKKPLPPPFKRHGWVLGGLSLIPEKIGASLNSVPGLVVRQIVWKSNGQWSLEGDFYVE